MNKSIRAADILVTGQWPSSCYIPDAARSLKTKEVRKMKWNLKKIMLRAWSLYRKGGLTFGEALHRAWLTAKAEPINAETVESESRRRYHGRGQNVERMARAGL